MTYTLLLREYTDAARKYDIKDYRAFGEVVTFPNLMQAVRMAKELIQLHHMAKVTVLDALGRQRYGISKPATDMRYSVQWLTDGQWFSVYECNGAGSAIAEANRRADETEVYIVVDNTTGEIIHMTKEV